MKKIFVISTILATSISCSAQTKPDTINKPEIPAAVAPVIADPVPEEKQRSTAGKAWHGTKTGVNKEAQGTKKGVTTAAKKTGEAGKTAGKAVKKAAQKTAEKTGEVFTGDDKQKVQSSNP